MKKPGPSGLSDETGGRPTGMRQKEHWFVITSGAKRCADSKTFLVNALACFALRGPPEAADVILDAADGFPAPTACSCDFFYPLNKGKVHSNLGMVSWERQQQIKSKVKEVLRF